MVKITVDGTEYDTDNMTDEQKELVELVRLNQGTSGFLGHAFDSVNAIGRVKKDELKASLSDGKKE
tara:strand:+ start:5879 stop:6076 length:198 start_codon:yes stop_codon:yes gene_type:complete